MFPTAMPDAATLAARFPDFYCECAFLDGMRDAERGTDSTSAYMRHGQPEPKGMDWYLRGFNAGRAAA